MNAKLRYLSSLAIATAIFCGAVSAHAQEERSIVHFVLPEQPLSEALRALGVQANTSIVFEASLLEGLRAPALDARLSLEQALRQLLGDSGMRFEWLDDKTVVVTREASSGLSSRSGQGSGGGVREMDAVLVTGTNIRTTLDAELQAAPVAVISRQDIEQTGAVSLADVLASNPAVTGGAAAEQGSGGRGFVNLRGLGTQYTLVLVNGRRLSANDPTNTLAIPADAIERVEILKSGASALYGSDAVAGVINVILKSRAEGIHASLTHGVTTQGGGAFTDMSVFGGMSSENARFFYLLNRMTRDEIRAGQRALTASSDKRNFGGVDARNNIGSPGRIGGVAGQPVLVLDPSRVPQGGYSLDPADYRPYTAATDLFDINAVIDPSVISAPTRTSIIVNFEQDFLDRRLTFFVSGLYWDMKEDNYQPMSAISFADAALGPIPASNPYNPFGQNLTEVVYRPLELGRRSLYTNADVHRLSAGLRAELGDWQVESAASWYRSGITNHQPNSIIKSRLKEALNRTGSNAFNPFCNQCNTAAQYEGLFGLRTRRFDFSSDLLDVRASGPLFDLPTGTLQGAVGGEYRREGVAVASDALTGQAGFVGSSGDYPYDLQRSIRSVFAEVRVPLMAAPEGAYESPLELALATRYEDYSDFGSTSNPMATLRYTLLDGQLTARASWAKAFLAPYMEYASPLYRVAGSSTLIDPLNGQAVEAQVFHVGTGDIGPETSVTRNVGLIFMPDAVPGMMVSLDHYRIAQDNLVPGTNPQSVLDGATPGTVRRGPGIGASGQDMIVEAFYYNLGRRKMSGYELGMHYQVPDMAAGRFKLDLAVARLRTFEVEVPGRSDLVDIAGGYDRAAGSFFSTGSLPRTRGMLGLSWNRGSWNAASQLNYMSGYDEMTSFGIATGDRVGSYATTDLQIGYTLGGRQGARPDGLPVKGARLSLGVENVFDREPPFLRILNNYNRFENSLIGRYVYARVGVDF